MDKYSDTLRDIATALDKMEWNSENLKTVISRLFALTYDLIKWNMAYRREVE